MNFDANIRQSIQKTNKKDEKMRFLLKKTLISLIYIGYNRYF